MQGNLWWTVPVPVAILEDPALTHASRCLYMALLTRGSPGAWQARATCRELAGLCGLRSPNPIPAHAAALERAGWVLVQKRRGRQAATYELRTPSGPLSAAHTRAVPASLATHPTLSPTARCLYVALLIHSDPRTRACSEAVPTVMRWTAVDSPTTLRLHARSLQAAGWLRVYPGHGPHTNTYVVLDPHRAAREAELERVRLRLERERYIGEAILKELLNVLVATDQFQDNARPGFLVNPLTGERLEFDRWYYKHGVAIEFNGPQHYQTTGAFPDPEQVRTQQLRDLVKHALARDHGVTIVVVRPQDLTFEGVRARLEGFLPLREVRREDPVVRYLTAVSQRYIRKAAGA
ncbi:hypothetical protein [Caldinitratiruptor microaerophilus]|uniref:Uncharacterized protein n=1 Tax=Caldinitratiruptor microaerophilus TaxID=671077 RepID=A0AA35G7L7_9FIRM|nr:hypothetical protein [Caldinitratiruptor microaerophilus]BDG59463.1 hypothetical protein caldi_05530 [Caldinitratiruptor microaerophilus]